MTCQELRLCFENPLRRDSDIESSQESEHLARCADCARFVAAQRELAAGLRCSREAVPVPPASLDAAILANYRKQIANRPAAQRAILTRPRFVTLGWSAAAAAVVLVIVSGIPLFHNRKAVTTIIQPQPLQSTAASDPAVAAAVAAAARSSRPKPFRAGAHLTAHPAAPPVANPALRPFRAPSPEARENAIAAGFRSLMYCDELSCGGAMEVIRVQLPSSVTVLAPASTSPQGVVFADVLVGTDGIARAIRIVE
jgi:hypothetical protein